MMFMFMIVMTLYLFDIHSSQFRYLVQSSVVLGSFTEPAIHTCAPATNWISLYWHDPSTVQPPAIQSLHSESKLQWGAGSAFAELDWGLLSMGGVSRAPWYLWRADPLSPSVHGQLWVLCWTKHLYFVSAELQSEHYYSHNNHADFSASYVAMGCVNWSTVCWARYQVSIMGVLHCITVSPNCCDKWLWPSSINFK